MQESDETPNTRHPLRKQQRHFLESCLTTNRTVAELMQDHKITPKQLGQWLAQPRFRFHVEKLRQTLNRQREMELSLGAKHGAELLHRTASTDEITDHKADRARTVRCRAAVELIRLARDSERRRKKMAEQTQTATEQPLIHPGNSTDETLRLLDALEGKQPSD